MAIGIFTDFIEVTMANGGPIFGRIGGIFGLGSIFISGAGLSLASALVAVVLIRRSDSRFSFSK